MKKLLYVIIVLAIIGIALYFSLINKIPEVENLGNAQAVAFTWKFEKAETLNLDGNPNTDIFLEVKYSDGEVVSKLIDTTAGSCNTLPDVDKDSLPNTTNIQCYSAGLGYTFKIIKGEKAYLVMRKTFEEGLPDYTPPPYKYEVVAEFNFSK